MPNNQGSVKKQQIKKKSALASKIGKTRATNKVVQKAKPKPKGKPKTKPKPKPKSTNSTNKMKVKTTSKKTAPPKLETCIPPLGERSSTTQDPNSKIINGREPVCFHAEQGPRDYMEDTYQVMHFNIGNRKGTFYGVFDGHGGTDVSHMLVHRSQGLFPFLIESLKRYSGKSVKDILRAGFLAYDEKLFNKDLKAGSTACIVLYYMNKIFIANLGDSRAMVFTEDNKLMKISQDHKPWLAVEKKRIYNAGYFVNPFKIYYSKSKKSYDNGDILVDTKLRKHFMYLNGDWEIITADQFKQILSMNEDYDTHRVCNSLALSRAFGDFYLKKDKEKKYMGLQSAISPEPDVDMIDLKGYKNKNLYILIGSDGFWDVTYVSKGLKQMLVTFPDGKKLCEKLVKDALKKGSQDNTTVLYDKFKI